MFCLKNPHSRNIGMQKRSIRGNKQGQANHHSTNRMLWAPHSITRHTNAWLYTPHAENGGDPGGPRFAPIMTVTLRTCTPGHMGQRHNDDLIRARDKVTRKRQPARGKTAFLLRHWQPVAKDGKCTPGYRHTNPRVQEGNINRDVKRTPTDQSKEGAAATYNNYA